MVDPYLEAGHPAIELAGRSNDSRTATLDSWIDDFGSFLQSLSERVLATTGGSWERHYLFVQWGGLRLALDEISVVTIVAATLSLALVLAFFAPRRLRPFSRLSFRLAWMLPLATLAIYAALSVATALLSALAVVR